MANTPRWKEGTIKHGIGTITFTRWRHFVTYINKEMLEYNAYIWRGHRRSDWKLESTLYRLMKDTGQPYSGEVEVVQLEQFKEASRGRRGRNPAQLLDDNDWWALGQHHGLATPLLDWTASPFAAAFFAFVEDHPNRTPHRTVYALHRATIERQVAKLRNVAIQKRKAEREQAQREGRPLGLLAAANYDPLPEIEFIKPRTDENQRLIVQNGLFSRMQDGESSLEGWLERNLPKDDDKNYALMRCLIPDRDREEALRMLNRMNLNHATLFPDLSGASWFCNVSRAISKY